MAQACRLLYVWDQNGLHSKAPLNWKTKPACWINRISITKEREERDVQIWTLATGEISQRFRTLTALLFQSTRVLFLAPTQGGSQPAETPGSGDLTDLASLGTAHMPPTHLYKRIQNSGQQTHTKGLLVPHKKSEKSMYVFVWKTLHGPKVSLLLVGRDLPLLPVNTGWLPGPRVVHVLTWVPLWSWL